MKQLICEMCGGNDLIKQDGVFVCQNCGTKYTVEEAKKMMKEVVEKVESATDAVKEATDFFKEHIDGLKEKNNELFTLFPTKGIEESQYYVLEHLRDTDYVADDIFDDFTFDETQNAFTSVAVFGGPITYHWTASSGFDREEKYTEYVEKTEVLKNGEIRTYKEPVTKTRIVTDWRPSSGTVSDYYTNHFVVDPNNFSKKDGFFRNHISSNADFKQENSISLWQVYKDQENGEQISSSWENSSLRSFLNGEFLDEFPKSIHRLIMEVDLPNIAQSGEDYGTTKDKVFLLSAVSDKHYIDAIIENGMIINSTTFTRTPASNTTVVSIDVENYFDGTGNHYAIGEQEVSNSYYIRPCMWIDIS